MKKMFQVAIFALAQLGGSLSAPAQQPQPNATPAVATALSIPDDAVDLGGGRYRWTDEQDRKWVYVRMPAGVTRIPEDVANARPTGVPEGAFRAKDGTWHYTDVDGKKWKYVPIPTGVAKFDEVTTSAPETANSGEAAKAARTETK